MNSEGGEKRPRTIREGERRNRLGRRFYTDRSMTPDDESEEDLRRRKPGRFITK